MTSPHYPQRPEPERQYPPLSPAPAPGSVFDSGLSSDPLPTPPPPPFLQDSGALPSPPPPYPSDTYGAAFDTRLTLDPLPPPPPPWTQHTAAHSYERAATEQAQQAVVFESAVRAEVKQLESYFVRQTKRFRLFGMATVVCAAAVPVLIAAGVWDWLAAAFGAVAAVAGSLQTLYRYQDSALSAMTLANNLEAEVVRYQTATTPYVPGSPGNFHVFVDRVTKLRGEATTSFSGVWSSAGISAGG